jgi:hypothetical protein
VYISVINEVIPEISSQYVCPRIVCLDFHHEFYKKVKKSKAVPLHAMEAPAGEEV